MGRAGRCPRVSALAVLRLTAAGNGFSGEGRALCPARVVPTCVRRVRVRPEHPFPGHLRRCGVAMAQRRGSAAAPSRPAAAPGMRPGCRRRRGEAGCPAGASRASCLPRPPARPAAAQAACLGTPSHTKCAFPGGGWGKGSLRRHLTLSWE